MRGWLKLAIVGVLAFALSLLITLPAHLAAPHLPAALHMTGLGGTVWSGSAERGRLGGVDLGKVRWSLRPLRLLVGRVAAEVSLREGEIEGQGLLSTGWGGYGADDLTLTGNTSLLAPYLSRYGAAVEGGLDADISTARVTDQGPQALDGELVWQAARLTRPTELPLGDVRVDLAQNADTAIAELRNDGRALGLNGHAELTQGWTYQGRLQIAPTEATPEEVRNALPVIGSPDASGAVTLRRSGELNPGL